MNFPPKKNIVFKTNLKLDVVTQRLFNYCSGPNRKYEGNLSKSTFEIKRVIQGQNSFLPRINGKIKTLPSGTLIEVDMKINTGVTIFMWIWLGGAGLLGLFFLPILPNPIALIPYAFLIFGIIMMVTLFGSESNRSKNDLQILFDAEIVEAY